MDLVDLNKRAARGRPGNPPGPGALLPGNFNCLVLPSGSAVVLQLLRGLAEPRRGPDSSRYQESSYNLRMR